MCSASDIPPLFKRKVTILRFTNRPDDMKTLLLSTTFLAAAHGMSIGAPKPFDTLTPGQVATVQLIEPISTSAAAGFDEVGLVIGIVSCGVSACPPPTEDLGEVIFVGKYESQDLMPNTQSTFRNYTFTVPSDISGLAAIDVQHISLLTPPGHSIPGIEYLGVAVQVGVGPSRNIHPINDTEKCVGILGGIYADGTPVDIFDCNGSASQKWQFNGNALTSINPADGSQWCLDAGEASTWTNGSKMKIWQCFSDLPQQSWSLSLIPNIIAISNTGFCLDLTNGNKTNQNILQIWQCVVNANQLWAWTFA